MTTNKKNQNRLANVVLYLLQGSRKPGLTKLQKLLYFSDYCHYQDHLKTITGMTYVAAERGPVLKNYEQELESLTELMLIDRKCVV